MKQDVVHYDLRNLHSTHRSICMENFIHFTFQILLKTPSGRSVSQGDSFSVNEDFKHALKKVFVSIIRMHISFFSCEILIENNVVFLLLSDNVLSVPHSYGLLGG